MEKLDDIKARLEKATPGPWKKEPIYGGDALQITDKYGYPICEADNDIEHGGDHNFEFIAHAPEDIRFLLDLVEKQRKEIEELTPTVNIPDINRTRVR